MEYTVSITLIIRKAGRDMKIRVKRITGTSSDYHQIKKLYHSSFPWDERAPFWLLMRRTGKEGVDFLSFYEDDQWIGFSYIISRAGISYVFYLAVNSARRGNGYGSKMLSIIKQHYAENRIFLAIEELDPQADNYSQRLKRLDFYEKNGFVLLGHKAKEAGVVYDLMSVGGDVSGKEYETLMAAYLGRILWKFVKIEGIDK